MAFKSLGLAASKCQGELIGRPDFIFNDEKVAVFCDGDFWHGNNWKKTRPKLAQGANPRYWVEKIAYNRRRDRLINRLLQKAGWKVVRLWESDIVKDPLTAAPLVGKKLTQPCGI